MNQLANLNVKSIDSLEISKLVNSRHDKVKQSIERLVSRGIIALPPLGGVVKNINNREYETEVYIFSGEQGKLDSITVVAQLCPEFTSALVKRWYELENQKPKELTRLEILQIAIEAERENIELKSKLEIAAPKVQYFDRVADTKNLLTASHVGKKIGLSAVKLNQYLADLGVYDRRISGRTFAQWFIDKGYGEVKQTEQGYPQSKFTNKGEQWIIEKLTSEGIVV